MRGSTAERFKPSIGERLKQSSEDKKLKGARRPKKEKTTTAPPVPVGPILVSITTNNADGFFGPGTGGRGIIRVRTATIDHNNTVWYQWSQTASTGDTWNQWQSLPITLTTTSGSTVWETWVDTPNRHPPRILRPDVRPTQPRPAIQVLETAEERRRRDEQYARFRQEEEEKNRRIREAYGRAMDLLKSCLNNEQRDSLEKSKFFYVTAPSGRKYRIDEGTHGNLKVVNKEGRVIERLCVQPNNVPAGDAMLVQKLMIETAEDALRRHANITLENGQMLYGDRALLDNQKLADIIPIRRAG